MKECSSNFKQRLKDVNSGLYCRWNGRFNRWQIMYKSDKTGMEKSVLYVTKEYDNLDGSPGDRLLYMLRTSIRWDLVNRFELTNEMLDEMDKEEEIAKKKLEDNFDDQINEYNKENQFNWAKALGTGRVRIFEGA